MDAIYRMAKNVVDIRYEDLPREAIEATKKDILDTLGTILAGSSAAGCRELVSTLLQTYISPQSGIFLYGKKVSSPEAALANATMGHALDLDDTHDRAVLHAGVSVFPASVAIAEQMGGVTGKDLITAVTLGIDLACRMGLASGVAPITCGWVYTSVYGYFGAAASAGKLLGLNLDQMVNAMGIAYAQAAGNIQCVLDGALTKRMQPGFAARGGLLSALLAKSGITGAKNILEGKAGLYRVYLKDDYDPAPLVSELGEKFEGVNLSFKPYPCCRYTHTSIDATLQLVKAHRIDADEVDEITVAVNQQGYDNVCVPLEVRANPRVVVDTQFSIPYCIATAIVKKEVFIKDFTEQEMRNPRVLQVAQKVRPIVDEEMERRFSRQITPAAVNITMKGGKTYSARKDFPSGSPEDPMDFDELEKKFRQCAGYAIKALSPSTIDRVVDRVKNLESMDDVREIADMLV